MNRFDKLNNAIEGAESSIITLVTTLIPWGAPALPAWLTFSHLYNDIEIPLLVAVAMAFCVEGLGLAAVSTAFSAMRHNKSHTARVDRVSLAFPIAAYLFYLAIIVVVNVALSWPMPEEWRVYVEVLAVALLTTISAPAFIIAVARQDQRKADKAAQERRDAKKSGDDTLTSQNDTKVSGGDTVSKMSIQDIMATYGVGRRQAYRIRDRIGANGDGAKASE